MRTSSYDIQYVNMGTPHPNKNQASSRTNKDVKKYIKRYIQGEKNKYMGKRKDTGHRCDWIIQKTEVDLRVGRACQQGTRWTMDIANHHLESQSREKKDVEEDWWDSGEMN